VYVECGLSLCGKNVNYSLCENIMPRKIGVPKRDEISEQFMLLYNEKLCDVFRSAGGIRILIFRML
jgi:hypothetical protein